MEQVREFDGEQAYEKMMRAMEEARQEKARQVERSLKFPALKRPERRGTGTQRTGAGLWPQPLGLSPAVSGLVSMWPSLCRVRARRPQCRSLASRPAGSQTGSP